MLDFWLTKLYFQTPSFLFSCKTGADSMQYWFKYQLNGQKLRSRAREIIVIIVVFSNKSHVEPNLSNSLL